MLCILEEKGKSSEKFPFSFSLQPFTNLINIIIVYLYIPIGGIGINDEI